MSRRFGLLAGVCMVLVCWLAWPAGSWAAGSAGGQVVGDGQLVTLPAGEPVPSSASVLPPLAGLAFWAPTVEAATSQSFATSQGRFSAASGDVLVFVAVDSQVFTPPFGSIDRGVSPPPLTLTAGSAVHALRLETSGLASPVAGSTNGDQGSEADGRWLIAVPAGSAPVLTASEAGFSQSDDLTSGQRVGPAPSVLYRDGAGPLGLDVHPSPAGQLSVQTPGGPVVLPVTVNEAVLSWFRLDEKTGPPSGLPDDQAYLLVSVRVGAGGDPGGRRAVLAGGAVGTLVTAGPARGAAMASAFAPHPLYEGAVLNGVFGVVVPATAGAVTVTVGAASSTQVAVETGQSVTPQVEAATVTMPAQFTLTFPPPSPVPTPAAPSTSVAGTFGTVPLATAPAGQVDNQRPVTRPAGGGSAVWFERAGAAGGAGVVVVVLGVVVWRRKTVLVQPTPVEDAGQSPAAGPTVETPTGEGDPSAPPVLGRDGEGDTVPGVIAEPATDTTSAADRPQLVVRVLGPLEVHGTKGGDPPPVGAAGVDRLGVVLSPADQRRGPTWPVGILGGRRAVSEDAAVGAVTAAGGVARRAFAGPDSRGGLCPGRAAGDRLGRLPGARCPGPVTRWRRRCAGGRRGAAVGAGPGARGRRLAWNRPHGVADRG